MKIEKLSADKIQRETWDVEWKNEKWSCFAYRKYSRDTPRKQKWALSASAFSNELNAFDGRLLKETPLPVDVIAEVRRKAAEAPIVSTW